jgi:hypothetical protein
MGQLQWFRYFTNSKDVIFTILNPIPMRSVHMVFQLIKNGNVISEQTINYDSIDTKTVTFSNVQYGNYTYLITPESGYIPISGSLTVNKESQNISFYYLLGGIFNFAFTSSEHGTPPVQGVVIELLKDNVVIETLTTDASGLAFSGYVENGLYTFNSYKDNFTSAKNEGLTMDRGHVDAEKVISPCGSLSVYVGNKLENKPIEGATVYLTEQIQGVTDENGKCSLSEVTLDTYTVTITKDTYITLIINYEMVQAGNDDEIICVMQLDTH